MGGSIAQAIVASLVENFFEEMSGSGRRMDPCSDPLKHHHYLGCFAECGRGSVNTVSVFSVHTYMRLVFRSVFPCSTLVGRVGTLGRSAS